MLKSRNRPGSIDTLSHGRGGGGIGAALPFWFVACLTGTFFLISFVTQLSTNEAWVASITKVDVWHPSMGVLWQLPALIGGTLPPEQTAPVVTAWIIESVILAFGIGGYNTIHDAVHNGGMIQGLIFEGLAIAGAGLNFYTDYLYGTIAPGQEHGHLVFAIVNTASVTYLGVITWYLLRKGYSRL